MILAISPSVPARAMAFALYFTIVSMGGVDFGPPGQVHPQANMGDFFIPQRGVLAIGQAEFDAFNPELHSNRLQREGDK